MSQTNTQLGDIRVLAGEDLTGMEDRLVMIANASGTPKAYLPNAISDFAFYVLTEAAVADAYATLRPLESGKQVRVRLNSTCVSGDILVLEDPTSNAGKVRKIPTAAGTYRGLGIAEESGADEQLVLMRHISLGNITVTE